MSKLFILLLPLLIIITGCSELDDLFMTDDASQQIVVVGDPIRGEKIFKAGTDDIAPPCSTCHLVTEGGYGMSLAPNLMDISSRVGEYTNTLTTEDYIRESIIDPEKLVVPGYRVSMYPDYGEHLSEQDLADLIAYLMDI